ncbi:DUF3793 family protein [Synergistaceae bacterium OttesenSCG-928-I11]|nr:DUF3793 family protein [Synergistaceae bacterium OttesenSCG-928-I11]
MPIVQQFMMLLKTQSTSDFIESMITCFAAPVVAGLKCGGLLKVSRRDPQIGPTWRRMRHRLARTLALDFAEISVRDDALLLFIYRREAVFAAIACPQVQSFLRSLGYEGDFDSPDPHIETLVARLKAGMPHEVGIFLGYPLEDVKGFIENGGRNSKFAGYWKVYGDEIGALEKFGAFRRSETESMCNVLEKAGASPQAA